MAFKSKASEHCAGECHSCKERITKTGNLKNQQKTCNTATRAHKKVLKLSNPDTILFLIVQIMKIIRVGSYLRYPWNVITQYQMQFSPTPVFMASHSALYVVYCVLLAVQYTVSVLGQEEGYTVKYCLS